MNELYKGRSHENFCNFLTETSCEKIQKILRDDYFKKLQRVSPNNKRQNVYDVYNKHETIQNEDNIKEKPTRSVAKQIMFSNKIRKDNYNWIKTHKRKNAVCLKELDLENEIKYNTEEYKKQLLEGKPKKMPLPVIKKIYKDHNPIIYNIRYIDEIENKYIQPYLNNNNIVYTEFIENKRSKAPFNFYIS